MEHLKTQWETPKNQQNINRISPRINGHFQKSIETWNIQKKKTQTKKSTGISMGNPQRSTSQLIRTTRPRQMRKQRRAGPVRSQRRAERCERHAGRHGPWRDPWENPWEIWEIPGSWICSYHEFILTALSVLAIAGAQHMAFISQCQTPDSKKSVPLQAVAIYSESLIICRSEGLSSDSRVNSAVVILYIYIYIHLKYVYNC